MIKKAVVMSEPNLENTVGNASRFFIEIGVLFRIQFSIIREQWIWVFLMAAMFPFTTLLFMKFFIENPTPEAMIRIIAGNMIFGVIVMGMNAMGQDISWQKHQGHFTFYASLPIYKMNFVMANLLKGFMNSFPSLVIMAGLGQLVYGIQFHYSWAMIPVVILSVFSISGIGVCLGFWSPNHQLTNIITQVLLMVVSFLTPVMVDMHQLPLVLQWVSYIFPTTYAAEALRDMLVVGWTHAVTVNMLIMLGYSVVTYFIIQKCVHWRVNQ
jgi:ABC-2 type transport system permease protein